MKAETFVLPAFCAAALGGEFVLAGRRLQLFELQLHLVEKARRAFRARPENLPPHLLDLQLQMRDQLLIGGELRLRGGGVRLSRNPPASLRDEQGAQRVDIIGKIGQASVHDPNKSINPTILRAYFAPDLKCRGIIPPLADAMYAAGFASLCPPTYRTSAPPKSPRLRPPSPPAR